MVLWSDCPRASTDSQVIMTAVFAAKGKQQADVHYVNAGISCAVEENFEGSYHDHDHLVLAEVLQDQESVYQSLQRNTQNNLAKGSSGTDSKPDHDCGQSGVSTEVGNSLEFVNVESQVALDEAFAMALQELENQIVVTSINETIATESENNESTSTGTSALAAGQDDIDPDNMTYEELQSLGEVIGSQSRGLSKELISFLPSFRYKTGFFSRKDKNDECVICYMPYKKREVLITLPCQHHYHSSCITRWLMINKACPVCNEDVFGS